MAIKVCVCLANMAMQSGGAVGPTALMSASMLRDTNLHRVDCLAGFRHLDYSSMMILMDDRDEEQWQLEIRGLDRTLWRSSGVGENWSLNAPLAPTLDWLRNL